MPRLGSSYSTAERGGGEPVELYTLQRGTKVWRYTSADSMQTVSGIAFTPAVVKRSAIEQKRDTPGIQYTVTVSLETPFGQDLLDPSGEPVTCTLQRVQTAGTPIAPVLAGEVTAIKFTDDEAELTVATIERRFKTLIPRVPVQRTCPWTLYSSSCGVDKASFATATTILTVTSIAGGYTLTLDATQTDGYWTNGIIKMDAGGAPLFIAAHTGSDVTIWGQIPSTVVTAAGLTIYAGCDKNRSTCLTKFNNLDNFGGFPDMPSKDPKLTTLDKTFAPGSIT